MGLSELFSSKPKEILLVVSEKKVECIYCHAPLKSESMIVRCPVCYTIHHPECWKEGKGCGMFGCSQSPKRKR